MTVNAFEDILVVKKPRRQLKVKSLALICLAVRVLTHTDLHRKHDGYHNEPGLEICCMIVAVLQAVEAKL